MALYLEERSADSAAIAGDCYTDIPRIMQDGAVYDSDLDRFLIALPTMGLRSHHSLRAYGYDILVWARFLEDGRHKSLWLADQADVMAYHRVRRRQGEGGQISGASWNRGIAALDKLYRWATEEELIAESPFRYRQVWRRSGYGGRSRIAERNQSYERGVKRGDVRFVSVDDFRRFRDVGLLGLSPDGRVRPGARDRNTARNALFAELLITTGLRLEEASSLLASELTDASAQAGQGAKQIQFRLPAALTKGDKGRTILLPVRLLKALDDYISIERSAAVGKCCRRRGWAKVNHPLWARSHRPGRLWTRQDREAQWVSVSLDALTPGERRRLVLCDNDGQPVAFAALWLSETGFPVAPNTWEVTFQRASQRCREAGFPLNITPHQLRHSFAVYLLSLLIEQQGQQPPLEVEAAGLLSYRRLLGDPLQQVQRLLGHASLETTYVYLDHLAGIQSAASAAADILFDTVVDRPGRSLLP